MKAALCQLGIKFEDREANIIRAEKYIRESAEAGADIVFFPEMTLTGFSMNVEKTGEEKNETIELMKNFAVKYGIAAGFGWVKKAGNKGENHYSAVSSSGKLLADYIKIHPFSYSGEDRYYDAGEKLVSFEYCGKKISFFICYDLRFPELFQAASAESEIIVVAANWPEKRVYHWETLLAARAIENQSWFLGVNCYGTQLNQYYNGSSRVIMPDGTVCESISDREGLIFADINDEAEEFRSSFPVKKDRKNEFYSRLLNIN